MAEEFLEILKKIAQKSVSELTEVDIAFLKARQDYLSAEDKEKFAEVLGKVKKEKIKVARKKPR